ncbi:TlpA family protein disulfide reductase [Thalassotalea hakodatensis]|uniref:TlpA family protein disulfide reductase n=1 Tax=Thalassotalea hakodatensis TaxID=3030492 RepID=UPI0025745F5C|nr:redoxin family protein [Thalassotalea hakodatensis]
MINALYKSCFFTLTLLFSWSALTGNLPNKLLNEPILLLSGEQTSLANSLDKKPVYLKFWATWCQPCLKEMPHFQHVQEEYGEAVDVISINIGINDDINSINKVIEKFGLTMPTTIDKSGDLAKAFNFIGTPYHLLFDKQMNLVHLGHEATESLDNKISLLSQQRTVELLDSNKLIDHETRLTLSLNDGRIHALFFSATWCDWYLKDSRPAVSQRCINAQKIVSALAKKFPNVSWQGLVSRLWTGDSDLAAYKKKYAINYLVDIDKSNSIFHQYGVNELPELILIKDNEVLFRSNRLNDDQQLDKTLALLKTAGE